MEALPASGGVGETDMNSVVSKRKKFKIRHGKSLKETYNPNQPREPKGSRHGGRWTSYKGGNCYSSAFHTMSQLGKHGILVHAIVSGQGVLTGKRFDHAWTEINDTVIDHNIVMSKANYYALGKVNTDPREYKRYTYDEMVDKAVDTGTYGPWDLDLSKTQLDVPWRPDSEPTFVEFPSIPMNGEDQTINKETIAKLHLTENELKARRRVLQQGNNNKSEHLIAIDATGNFEENTTNELTHVTLSNDLVYRLRDGNPSEYTMVHNHPWDSSLSRGDLGIAAFPGVKRMFAHVATGSIYSVEQTQLLRDVIKYSPTKYQKLWDAMGISARTINEILSPFNPGFNLEMLGVASEKDEAGWLDNVAKLRKYWWRIASHLNCLLLNDAGVFKYTYHMDPKLEAFYAPLIKKARESKDWKISSNMIYHEMLEEVNKHKPDNDPFDNLKLYKHTINDES